MTSFAPALTLALVAIASAGCDAGAVGSQQGYEPVQPVAFSHATHAGEYQLACQYCHSNADKSKHAGVPPLATCMNCHTQIKKDSPEIAKIARAYESKQPIQWVRVHRFPDYAHFSHASHVGKGVQCQKCHGPVETMVRIKQVETMSMGWCLDCHRNPESSGAPDPASLKPPTDCVACHH